MLKHLLFLLESSGGCLFAALEDRDVRPSILADFSQHRTVVAQPTVLSRGVRSGIVCHGQSLDDHAAGKAPSSRVAFDLCPQHISFAQDNFLGAHPRAWRAAVTTWR